MNKEEYKDLLRNHYPEEPENVLELAWHFHGVDKAKKYIKVLMTCNNYADVATKAILKMYVSCDIDSVKAVSEKFIAVLLPFTCMERATNAHSVTYHVRKMLDNKDVKRERRSKEEQMCQEHILQQANVSTCTADISIQIQFATDNEDFIRQILYFAETSNKVFIKVEKKHTASSLFALRQDLAAIHSLKSYLYKKLASSFRRCLALPLSTREKVRRVVWG